MKQMSNICFCRNGKEIENENDVSVTITNKQHSLTAAYLFRRAQLMGVCSDEHQYTDL
jgi:hypothetical protein